MFNPNHAVLAVLLWVISMAQAWACSCAHYKDTGFLTAWPASDSSYDSKIINYLPSNAKGVVFQRDIGHSFEVSDGRVLREPPTPLVSENFAVRDLGSGKKISAVVERLRVDPPGQVDSARYFAISNRRLESCLNRYEVGNSESCLKLIDKLTRDGLLEELHDQNKLVDVTAQVKRFYGLFRISPKGGFKVGHRYGFSYLSWVDIGRAEFPNLKVKIDSKPLDWSTLKSKISLERNGEVELSLIDAPMAVSCWSDAPARIQKLRYVLPEVLEPYRDSLRLVTMVRRDQGEFTRWYYDSSLCAREILGDGVDNNGGQILNELCDNPDTHHLTAAKGMIGFLEIEDTWYETATLPLAFAEPEPRCAGGSH